MRRREFLKSPALGMILPAAGAVYLEPILIGPRALMPDGEEEARYQQKLHPDFVTYYPGMEYFFMGNGDIQAVVQFAPEKAQANSPSFLGFSLMDADHFARKWSTFLFHPEIGFGRTLLTVTVNDQRFALSPASFQSIRWEEEDGVPVVTLLWMAGACEIKEKFFVPSEGAMAFRTVEVKNKGLASIDAAASLMLVPNFTFFDEIGTNAVERRVEANGFAKLKLQCLDADVEVAGRYDIRAHLAAIPPEHSKQARFVYSLRGAESLLRTKEASGIWGQTVDYWKDKNRLTTDKDVLNRLYAISRTCLKAMVSRDGKRDSGTWMYNMEWVRDDVFVTLGMLHAGFFDEARSVLLKILQKSVGEDGRTIESGRWFGYDYTEIDQNGQLLYALWSYVCWTGDDSFVRKYWKRIRTVADFPLQDYFLDKTAGMLHNKREFWERSDSFGVEDGFELAYQCWVILGLEKASELAVRNGETRDAERWQSAATRIKQSMLHDPKFQLVENGHFIKRRTRDGRWQQFLIPPNRARMPEGSPIAKEEKPACDPDTAEVYPIIFEMIDPKGELAQATLGWAEQLWNQRWSFGGYSRYNVSSEPDPPAPWPIASLLMARAYTEAGQAGPVWRILNWLEAIHGGKSGGWFERYGPSITPPAPPVSVVGWVWGEVAMLAVHHIAGLRPGLSELALCPRLLDGLNEIKGVFKVRSLDVDLTVTRAKDRPFALLDGKKVPVQNGLLAVPYPEGKKRITIEMHV